MIDEGAGRRSAIQLASEVQQIGAVLSLWASCDSSNLSLQVLSTELDRGLDLVADVLLRPRFEASEWSRVRQEMHGRALQRRSRPADAAGLGLSWLCYGGHPYARPLLPTPSEIAAIRLPAIRQLYRARYRRDQAVVVAAGDLTAAQLKRKLGRRLEGWSRARRIAGARPTAPPAPGRRLGLVDRPGAPQSALRVGHLCPPRGQLDWAGVKLLNTILGGSFTSRLNLNLRERHGFTYGVHSSFTLPRGPGLLSVGTSVGTEDTAAALREILRELTRLREKPVTRAELGKAQQLVIESLPAQAETMEDLADEYAGIVVHELPLDSLARLPEQVMARDREALHRLARELLKPEAATLVVVGDLARLRPELGKLAREVILLDEDGRPLGK